MKEQKPIKKVEEITSNIQNRELEKLYLLVDEFLRSEAVRKNMTILKPYYIAEYLLQKENQRAKRSDVLSIKSTPKKK